MALRKNKMLVVFGRGLDTKTDPKLVIPGKMTSLSNAVFRKIGRLDKRYGYEALSNDAVSGDSLEGATGLTTFNSELLQYNKHRLYSYATGPRKWADKGPCVSALATTKQIIKNTASQTQADYASNQGIGLYAWQDTRNGVRVSVIDESTGNPIVSDRSIDAAASRVRCISFSNYLYLFYYKTGSLFVQRLNPLQPDTFESAVLVSNTVNLTDPTYDVLPYLNIRIAVAHNVEGASEIKFLWLNDVPEVLAGSFAPTTIAEEATNCLGIVQGPGSRFFVVYHNSTDGLRCVVLNVGGAVLVSPTTVDSYIATNVVNVTGFRNRDGTGVTFFYQAEAVSVSNHFVRTNTFTNTGTAGTAAVFKRSVGLWSKAWSYYFDGDDADHAYMCLVHTSTLQSTYFVVRNDGLIVAKMQYATATGRTIRPILANVVQTGNQFGFAILNKTRLVSQNGDVFSLQGVCNTTLDFTDNDQFITAQLGNNLHIGGGVLSMYDGQSVVEQGFHLYPEDLSSALSGSSGLADGDYNFIALYEWTDAYGQIHRSAPSVPLTVTVSSGPKAVEVTVPTLRLTEKTAPTRSEVSIVLYRTEVGPGAIYYRSSPVTAPTYNDPSVDTVTITDTLPDADLINQEILYTTGDVLDNFAAPSCRFLTVYKDRLFLGGLEDPSQIWYSKIHTSGGPVEFSSELTIDASGNDALGVTSFAVLDDNLIVFKYDRFFITFGEGPNNTGQGGVFAPLQLVTTDVGCSSPKSIVRSNNGIMFKSSKGIYALGSDLSATYIGAAVEEFNSQTITSAVLKADDNQVRFTTSSGPVLVYDYYFGEWSTFQPLQALDSVIWEGQYALLTNAGRIFIETPGMFRDNGSGIQMSFITGWMALDSITGLQRVYKLSVVADYKSPHKLRISVGYDFSTAWSQFYTFDTASNLPAVTSYGEDSPYGDQEVYGGENGSYRFVIRLDQQKCQALRIMVEDLTTSGAEGSGEALTITAIGLEVGIKGQTGKFRQQQQIGSS